MRVKELVAVLEGVNPEAEVVLFNTSVGYDTGEQNAHSPIELAQGYYDEETNFFITAEPGEGESEIYGVEAVALSFEEF